MPTPNLNLPTIDRNMFVDVPRDMNALAYAVDDAVRPNGKIALRQDLQSLQQSLNNHINDNIKHVTQPERDGWNKAVVDIGDKNILVTQNKDNLVLAINELFQSSSDKNDKIAAAITEQGVPTSPTATSDQMAANIRLIKGKSKSETLTTPAIPPNSVNLNIYSSLLDFEPKYIMTSWGAVNYIEGQNRGSRPDDNNGVSGYTVNREGVKWRIQIGLTNTMTSTHPADALTYYAFEKI